MRQPGNQVKADILETVSTRGSNQCPRVIGRVQASDRAQLLIIKGLRADAEAVDAKRQDVLQEILVRRSRRDFQSEFHFGTELEPPVKSSDYLIEAIDSKKRGRSAPDVNRVNGSLE